MLPVRIGDRGLLPLYIKELGVIGVARCQLIIMRGNGDAKFPKLFAKNTPHFHSLFGNLYFYNIIGTKSKEEDR